MEEKRPCSICGTLHTPSALTEFDGEVLCGHCLNHLTLRCQRCGRRIWQTQNAGNEETILCRTCYDYYYTTCADCHRILPQDDVYYDDDDSFEPHCYACQCQRNDRRVILDYSYKPPVLFYGTDSPLYLGVELEVDAGGESQDRARALMAIANAGNVERAFCKHDGSLSRGFEIVSHAMTLRYHETEMPWKVILEKAKDMGYLSHCAGSCGLHIHVSKSALGDTEEAQDTVIARILYFLERFWPQMRCFSRRTDNQITRWCARYGYQEHPTEILKTAKQGYERYTCLNLLPPNTIEFRLFRGSLRYITFAAALQMTEHICTLALKTSDEDMKKLTWEAFVATVTKPELRQYLRERGLCPERKEDA